MKQLFVGAIAAIALASPFVTPVVARADSTQDLGKTRLELERTRSELQRTRSELTDVKRELDSLRQELRRIRLEPRVRKSYQEALGRDPVERELSYWIGKADSSSYDQMIASHLDWLTRGGGQQELPQVIRRAYKEALNREPNLEEATGWTNRVKSSRETYAQIVQALRTNSAASF